MLKAMSTINDIFKEIRRAIINAADPETKAKVSRLTSGAKSVGVIIPKLRALAAAFRREHPDLSIDDACKLVDKLCRELYREEILFGIFLLGSYGKKVASLAWDRLREWIEALDNWETCDHLASNVSGPIVATKLEYVDNLAKLARSKNLWKRRFAVATASELNHKGRLHPEETFRVCRLLLADPEPMVSKAVGWAIKELSKKDEAAAYAFLDENKHRIPANVLREASVKLSLQNRKQILG